MSVHERLLQHLATWGLREFRHEGDYYAWQRESLSPQVLHRLHALAENRQGGTNAEADQAFYDLASSSTVLPILYSQRFGYYRAVGTAIIQCLDDCLQSGQSVLDLGCGVGILTTWYASVFPDCVFTGVDRSSRSIAVARQHAEALKLNNLSFHARAIPEDDLPGTFDVVIATQALFQSETDPGLPSRSWEGFEREDDAERQTVCETRTGIGERLDWALRRMNPTGRLLAFEKASHLGRRVLFQRTLASRGLYCDRDPVFLRYSSVDEHMLDGPLYSLTLERSAFGFDETPLLEPLDRVYRCQGKSADWVWSRFLEFGSLEQPVSSWSGDQQIQWQVCRTEAGFVCWRLCIADTFVGVLVGAREDEAWFKSLVEERIQSGHHGKSIQEALRGLWSTGESSDFQLTPLYENHTPSAQDIWQRLPDRVIHRETTQTKPDGQQFHVELGHCAGHFVYLYWANTFDQRQIVVMEKAREPILEEYFSESGELS